MSASDIIKLRKRAEAVFCRVRVFKRKDYRSHGKPIRYEFVDEHGGIFASNIIELRDLVRRAEAKLARRAAP
jgi:hypothetical protein